MSGISTNKQKGQHGVVVRRKREQAQGKSRGRAEDV